MATVQHPALPRVTREVDNVDEWVQQGWVALSSKEAAQVELQHEEPRQMDRPARNASLEDWQRYALGQDWTPEDLEGKGRDELRDSFPE